MLGISTLFLYLNLMQLTSYLSYIHIFITPFIVNTANFLYHRLVLQLKNSYFCAKIKRMGTKEKLIARFSTLPNDFTWEEMRRLLVALGYVPGNKGKTSGSRVIFKGEGLKPIMLHKPHPGNIIKEYVMKQVYDYLKNEGLI